MRRGTSATEVIVATLILALALVPIIHMISSGGKPTAFSEYHLVAQSVATHLVDRVTEVVLSHGFGEIEAMATGVKTSIQETRSYKLDLDHVGISTAEGSFFQQPRVFLTNLSETGGALVQISVSLTWTLPGDRQPHTFSLERLLSRPDSALSADYLPKQEGGGPK